MSKTPHTLFLGLLLGLTVFACSTTDVDFQLSLDAPSEVSVSAGPEDINIFVRGEAPQFPITAVLGAQRCPDGASCEDGRTTFEQRESPLVWREALSCDLPSDEAYLYSLEVFDTQGLTTQPARFSFQCLE